MEKHTWEELFGELREAFDTEEPRSGHRGHFLEKLKASSPSKAIKERKRLWWKPLSAAAAILVFIAIGLNTVINYEPTVEERVAKISPEASNTQFYFTNLIEEEVKKLKEQNSPETQKIIEDTILQLENLESDYAKLEQNLLNGGNSKLLLSAMITNFQTRIDLLHDVLEQIEIIKNLKEYNDENLTI